MTDSDLFLIPSLPHDALLHPARRLPMKPLAAAEVMTAINRLPKKGKRLFAWMHNTLVAAVRSRLGKSPADVEATLKAVGIEAAIARRASAWWRDALSLRDNLAPMVRSWNETEAEGAAAARAGHGLLEKPEYAPAQAALIADLSLLACALGASDPLEILQNLYEDDFAGAPMTASAVRCASDAAGAGDPADQDAEAQDESPAEELSENGCTKTAEAVCDALLPKLAASNQVFLSMSLTILIKSFVWLHQHPDRLAKCREHAGLDDDDDFRHVVRAAMTLEDFSQCLAGRVAAVDMTKIRFPNPKTEEAARERCDKMAAAVLKAMDQAKGDEIVKLRSALLCAGPLITLLNGLADDERLALAEEQFGDEVVRGYFPMCMMTLMLLAQKLAAQAMEILQKQKVAG